MCEICSNVPIRRYQSLLRNVNFVDPKLLYAIYLRNVANIFVKFTHENLLGGGVFDPLHWFACIDHVNKD
jgi:hypothetical protein